MNWVYHPEKHLNLLPFKVSIHITADKKFKHRERYNSRLINYYYYKDLNDLCVFQIIQIEEPFVLVLLICCFQAFNVNVTFAVTFYKYTD